MATHDLVVLEGPAGALEQHAVLRETFRKQLKVREGRCVFTTANAFAGNTALAEPGACDAFVAFQYHEAFAFEALEHVEVLFVHSAELLALSEPMGLARQWLDARQKKRTVLVMSVNSSKVLDGATARLIQEANEHFPRMALISCQVPNLFVCALVCVLFVCVCSLCVCALCVCVCALCVCVLFVCVCSLCVCALCVCVLFVCVCSLCVLFVCALCVCSLCVLFVRALCVCSLCVLFVCALFVCSLCVLFVCDLCVCSLCVCSLCVCSC